jgi:hypothetical protein
LKSRTISAATFGTITLEAFIDALQGAGETDHAAALFSRYVDWSLIDDEMEASFSAALAG